MNPRKAATLVATLVEYAVKNVNLAVDALDLQREEFDDDDDFFNGIMAYTSTETDNFIVDMATSEPYLPSTIEALKEKGYRVVEDDDDDDEDDETESECCPHQNHISLQPSRLLKRRGNYRVVEDDDDDEDDETESECCPQKMVECLVRSLGKKATIMMVMEQE